MNTTTLVFYILDKTEIDKYYNILIINDLQYSKKIKKNENKIIDKIDSNLIDEDDMKIIEICLLKEKNIDQRTFYVQIYINNINNIYLSLNKHDDSNFGTEFIFFSYDSKRLPDFLSFNNLNNNEEFKIYDNCNLEKKKRFVFLNVPNLFLTFLKNEKFDDKNKIIENLNKGSYKLCIRISKNEDNYFCLHQINKKQKLKILNFSNEQKEILLKNITKY